MTQNIAIIDLGSNLTKLVVVAGELPLTVIHRSIYDTKTLKNAPKGHFDSSSIKAIEQDIQKVLEKAKELGCGIFLGIATSAFRTRTNGAEVIEKVNAKFGIRINIIEGQREAKLIYKGAMASVKPKAFPVLIMDIGGGSTEFIIGDESRIFWEHSFDFGSTALSSGLQVLDPLSNEDIHKLNSKLMEVLPLLWEQLDRFKPISFIGTTGAFESFAQIPETKQRSGITVDSGYSFNRETTMQILQELMESTMKQRQQTKGLKPERIATIHIAALILKHVLTRIKFDNMQLSLGDVKEGLALEYLESKSVN